VNRRSFLARAAGLPVALALAPEAFAGRSGGTPTALVTADTEAHVAVVDVASGRILRRIPTLAGPRSVEAAPSDVGVVAHTQHGAVTLVDGASLRARRVLRAFAEPRYTAAHPDGRHAYVTDSKNGEVVTIDVLRGHVVHRTDVGGPARHVSLSPTARRLWVALGTKARRLALLDTSDRARPRLLRRIAPPFLAHDVGFVPDGRAVWVTSGNRGSIALYDARTGAALARIAADAPPQHVTFAGGRAHVTSGDDGTLHVHALDGRRLWTARVPVGSYNVQRAGSRVLTPSLERGTLCLFDTRARLLHVVDVAPSSHDACLVHRR
jgi:DNA-binding beta-propeller fold protein YncE